MQDLRLLLLILLAPLPELCWHKRLCSQTVNPIQELSQLKTLNIFSSWLFFIWFSSLTYLTLQPHKVNTSIEWGLLQEEKQGGEGSKSLRSTYDKIVFKLTFRYSVLCLFFFLNKAYMHLRCIDIEQRCMLCTQHTSKHLANNSIVSDFIAMWKKKRLFFF